MFPVETLTAGGCRIFSILEMFLNVLLEVALVGVGGVADGADVAAVVWSEGGGDDLVEMVVHHVLVLLVCGHLPHGGELPGRLVPGVPGTGPQQAVHHGVLAQDLLLPHRHGRGVEVGEAAGELHF